MINDALEWGAHASGMLGIVAPALKDLLYGEPPVGSLRRGLPPGARVGIITFDKAVHFYNLKVNE